MTYHQKINRWLADSVSAVNAIIAILVVVFFTLAGGRLADNVPGIGFVLGCIFGGAAGAVVAVAVCGVLAVLIDIRSALADVLDASRRSGQ